MNKNRYLQPALLLGAAGVLLPMVAVLYAEPPAERSGRSEDKKSATSAPKVDDANRVPVAVARDRAKVMHHVYESTLDMLHHRFFDRDKAIVPARALEDVFSDIQRQSDIEARWISVNLRAMSIDHNPESDFERRAAKEIAAGKPEVELVEDGYYRRAGAIRLTSGCISCHAGFLNDASTTPKFAALVISVPVASDSGPPK